MVTEKTLSEALARYTARTGRTLHDPVAALFDMDGVLYDSMPRHSKAWKQMCDENGIAADPDEFYALEGRTGASTIDILVYRQFGRHTTDEEVRRLYARKSELFKAMGRPIVMPGALSAVEAVTEEGGKPVLVTGSGQASLLESLNLDYHGAFPADRRVTAHDVSHGKPHPEPYLKGLEKVGAACDRAVAIDNAPLGVESASAAGVLTIGVRTGPLPAGSLLAAGADTELTSMDEVAVLLSMIFNM